MKITPPPTPHRAPTAVGGDLSGSTATPVVSGLGGTPLDTTTPTTGAYQRCLVHYRFVALEIKRIPEKRGHT